MNDEIKLMIVEDDEMCLNLHKKALSQDKEIVIIGCAKDKETAFDLAVELNPDVMLLDINLTSKEDQHGIDLAINLSLKMPHIKIIMLSGLLNEDTVRSTIGLGVACNYLLKTNPENIPQAIKDAYNGVPLIKGSVIDFILRDYRQNLKSTMSKLTSHHIKVLELFYRGYCADEVANVLKLEIQSVRNLQQAIAKRCFGWGWQWRYRKLTTLDLAKRAKKMELF